MCIESDGRMGSLVNAKEEDRKAENMEQHKAWAEK